MKIYWIVVAGCLVQALAYAPAIAKENNPAPAGGTPAYFQSKSTDGEPVPRPAGCGNDGTRSDAFQRDLGQGVSILVIPAYDDAKLLSVNLIFRYHEQGALKIQPAKFELHSLQGQKLFHPGRMHRTTPVKDSNDIFYEEVYLEFSVPPESARQIAVIVPEGTVNGADSALKVNPVLFERTAGAPKSKLTPCIYSTSPPSALDASRLRAVPPVPSTAILPPPARALSLHRMSGAWVADGKASAEYFRNVPSSSMNELLSRAAEMFLFIYLFGDDFVVVSTAAGGKKTPYQLLSEEKKSGTLTFKNALLKAPDGDLLVLSVVSGDRIRIHSLRNELTSQFIYKRARWDMKDIDLRVMAEKEAAEEFKEFANALSPGSR